MAEGSWIRIGAIDAHLDARTINPIIEVALRKRAISITQKPDLRQRIGEELLRVVTPFVPMKTGELRASGRATTDGRLYWSAIAPARGEEGYEFNYAATVYDEEEFRWPSGNYAKPTTSGTFPRWMEKVQPGTPEWDAFVNAIIPLIVKEFAEDE